jgi:hypothetical protein
VLKCTVDHILQEFYTLFLTRFRTYKIASPSQTKMTSKDDTEGLVSLKFLPPWMDGWIEGGGGCLLTVFIFFLLSPLGYFFLKRILLY